jgi:protein-S-isoprenylcysteine O-methyltransferase Ste14
MAWPIVAILILAAFVGCWIVCAAGQVAWSQKSWPLAVLAVAVLVSLGAEVAALNGSALGGSLGGLGVISLLAAGIALAAFAIYLLSPPGEEEEPGARPRPRGPAANPDSEA